jgi:hypothetical protein
VRPENDNSDNHRPNCRHQDGTGGNILGMANQRMQILDGRVGEQLQGSIERFRCPHRARGKDDTTPFRRGELKEEPCGCNQYCHDRVYPCVVLRTKNVDDPVESVPHTFNSSGKSEWTAHCNSGRSLLALAKDDLSIARTIDAVCQARSRTTNTVQLDTLLSIVSFGKQVNR